MLQQQSAGSVRNAALDPRALTLSLARDQHEVREAQRLRYKVFAEEMGARLNGRAAGIDSDIFDP